MFAYMIVYLFFITGLQNIKPMHCHESTFSPSKAKVGDFALRKKGREKTRIAKVVKYRHQVTWAPTGVTKKRE